MFSKLFKVIVVLLLFISTKAQDSSSNKHDENPLHEPSMAGVLIVLLIMFILTFLIVAYAKFCNRPFSYYQSNDQQVQHDVLSRSRFSGIDRSVVESLLFFKFSSLKGSKDGLECAVCLSRFEEIEVLRLLPKCKHAFHMNCIDLWLENHSSCPICRHKFDVEELSRLSYTNSFRYPRNSGNLTDEPNLEIFIQRERDRIRSSRFNMSSTLQNIKMRSDEDDVLIKKGSMDNVDLHKFKHRIIVSDVICKTRWSDVNTSDLMFLNSEMLNVISNKRFEKTGSSSGRPVNEISTKKEFLKVKDHMDLVEKTRTSLLDPAEKRSMSEITNVSRFEEFSTRRRISGLSSPVVKNEKVWKLWVPIVKRTIQLYAGRESSPENIKHESNV